MLKLNYDRQSASLSLCQSPIWEPWLIFLSPWNFLLTVADLLFCSALSEEKTGLWFTVAAGPRQRSPARFWVRWDSRPYFIFPILETLPTWRARPPYLCMVEWRISVTVLDLGTIWRWVVVFTTNMKNAVSIPDSTLTLFNNIRTSITLLIFWIHLLPSNYLTNYLMMRHMSTISNYVKHVVITTSNVEIEGVVFLLIIIISVSILVQIQWFISVSADKFRKNS
jgi:hypothetical protein